MLFWIPAPYDYHEQAGYIVVAVSPEEAVEKCKAFVVDETATWWYMAQHAQFGNLIAVQGDIYVNAGCDC
jgi:hypothetical protein